MRQTASPFTLEGCKAGKVKGHTRIELTTVATGEKKVVEHSNVFQSAVLSKYLRSLGAYNNSPYANATWASRKLWRNLCGGILLFRDEIQAPAEYMPAGNQMVANGSFGINNAATPSELGSFNAIESSTGGNNSLSFVYDWGTSQGNGTISCVCLTSEIGGLIGYGNPSGGIYSSPVDIAANQNSACDLGGIPYNNRLYTFSRSGADKTVTITTVRKGIDEASIFDDQQTASVTKAYTSMIPGNGLIVNYSGGGLFKLIPFLEQSWDGVIQPAGTFKVLIYDAEADTLTEETVSNNSSNAVWLFGYNAAQNFAAAAEGKIILPTALTETTYGLPMVLLDEAGNAADVLPNTINASIVRGGYAAIAPGLLYFRDNTTRGFYIYDTVNKTIYPTNGAMQNGTSAAVRAYNDQVDALYTDLTQGLELFKNPLYLATVNNLDNPVTKDSTQTMKVIYTLTEAS